MLFRISKFPWNVLRIAASLIHNMGQLRCARNCFPCGTHRSPHTISTRIYAPNFPSSRTRKRHPHTCFTRKYKIQQGLRGVDGSILPMCSATVTNHLFPGLAESGNNVRANIVVVNLVRGQQCVGARAGGIQERRQWLEQVILSTTRDGSM